MSKKQSRNEARQEAFKLIFQTGVNRDDIDFLIEQLLLHKPESKQNLDYIKTVLFGVLEKEEELDRDITENLSGGWKINRISRVSYALLKLAIYEIKYMEDIPPKVSINEAVELDKKFDEPDNSAFINGVLGGYCRKSGIKEL